MEWDNCHVFIGSRWRLRNRAINCDDSIYDVSTVERVDYNSKIIYQKYLLGRDWGEHKKGDVIDWHNTFKDFFYTFEPCHPKLIELESKIRLIRDSL